MILSVRIMTATKVRFLDPQVEFRNCRKKTLNRRVCQSLTKLVWTLILSNLIQSQLSITAGSSTYPGANQLNRRCKSRVAVLRHLPPGSVLHSGNLKSINNLQMNIIYKTLAYTRCKLQKCQQKCRPKSKALSLL